MKAKDAIRADALDNFEVKAFLAGVYGRTDLVEDVVSMAIGMVGEGYDPDQVEAAAKKGLRKGAAQFAGLKHR